MRNVHGCANREVRMEGPWPTADDEPDPARSYERAKPEKEAGMGRLDNDVATPIDRPDQAEAPLRNAHAPHQLNAEDDLDARAAVPLAPEAPPGPLPAPAAESGSLLDEDPLGEDLVPLDIHDPRYKRHPRKEGKGGTP
jgi:hypothetical protein